MHEFLESLEPGGARVLRATASLREHLLPFGVVTQLFHGMTIPPPSRDRVRALLASAVAHTVIDGRLAEGGWETQVVDVFQKLTMELAHLAETTPLVICVDNAHYLDPPSLHFLAASSPGCIPPASWYSSPMTTPCGGRVRPCWPGCSRRAPTPTGSPCGR
ncbi:hypothetical protein ACFQ10_06400 [Streptomyces indonesiensis]